MEPKKEKYKFQLSFILRVFSSLTVEGMKDFAYWLYFNADSSTSLRAPENSLERTLSDWLIFPSAFWTTRFCSLWDIKNYFCFILSRLPLVPVPLNFCSVIWVKYLTFSALISACFRGTPEWRGLWLCCGFPPSWQRHLDPDSVGITWCIQVYLQKRQHCASVPVWSESGSLQQHGGRPVQPCGQSLLSRRRLVTLIQFKVFEASGLQTYSISFTVNHI